MINLPYKPVSLRPAPDGKQYVFEQSKGDAFKTMHNIDQDSARLVAEMMFDCGGPFAPLANMMKARAGSFVPTDDLAIASYTERPVLLLERDAPRGRQVAFDVQSSRSYLGEKMMLEFHMQVEPETRWWQRRSKVRSEWLRRVFSDHLIEAQYHFVTIPSLARGVMSFGLAQLRFV